MHPAIVLVEIALLSSFACMLHAARRHIGLGGVYALIGLTESFLFFAHQVVPELQVAMFGTANTSLSYVLFLPVMLTSCLTIYVLEGTREARRLIAVLLAVYVVHGVIDQMFALHIANPAPGEPDLSGSALNSFSHWSRVSSAVAILVDLVVVVVVYQAARNSLRWVPRTLALFVAIVLALVVDGLVYGGLFGFPLTLEGLQILEKAQAGGAAALPVAAYLSWQLRAREAEEADTDVEDETEAIAADSGERDRHALAILRLRAEVLQTRSKLAEQRREMKRVRSLFGRYVAPEVVEQLVEKGKGLSLGGEDREVSVLFVDIRSYSRIAEALEPQRVIGILNDYFGRISEEVLGQRGMIAEIEGDGLMAVFGAPNDLPGHREAAVRSALGIQQALEELNERWDAAGDSADWKALGLDRLSVRIGVHTGRVVVGNVGGEKRLKYGVVGDAVNIAARLESLNNDLGTELLISAETARDLHGFAVEDRGEHRLKGRDQAVRVFTVQD